MKNYIAALVGALLTEHNSWLSDSRPTPKARKLKKQVVLQPVTDQAKTPLEVHRYYTETGPAQVVKRRRGLDGTLRSSLSNRLRDIQLTGR